MCIRDSYLDCGDWEQAREAMGRVDQEEVEQAIDELEELISEGPVSYTHLDVYKRQG